MRRRLFGTALIAMVLAIEGTVLAGCGGHHQARRNVSAAINVAIVGNPNTRDLARLTPSLFTSRTGIKVNYTILDEGTLREVVTSDVPAGGRQFDAVMIGPYEALQFAASHDILDLTRRASSDRAYDVRDIIPSVRRALSYSGRLYAAPFYGESSFLMYRKDLLRAAGLAMPVHPTWRQVAAIARRLHRPGMAGICLRGKPGWGELGASFTTVLNTFGGTWWSARPDGSVGEAMVDRPRFRDALRFYVDLVRDAGEPHADQANYNECLAQYLAGKAAMWYDATVGAGLLEAKDSAVQGKNGYAPAPVERTRVSGWLWSWALAIPAASNKANLAWRYIAWATGPQYIREAGTRIAGGWAAVPPGTRRSTYRIPGYERRHSRSPVRRSPPSSPRPSTTRARPGGPATQASSTSASRSSRTSAISAPTSSPR